jgi:DNA-binding GntR family transcriptional regulator
LRALQKFASSDPSHSSLHERVFAQLRQSILDGTYEPGTVIHESRIAAELGVSRTPVREAFRKLEQEGLVTIIRNKGAVVAGVTEQDIKDIYAVRAVVEGLAAKWAAVHITPAQLQELEELLTKMDRAAQAGDFRTWRELDTRFHEVLYEASHSIPLELVLSAFHDYVRRARLDSLASPGRMRQAGEEHGAIVAALKENDPDLAAHALAEHCRNAAENWLRVHRDRRGNG